ncbi:MAG TPA: enolase C-terminal domain-like protein [Acidobacteriaceae bacterium]|jgi:L-alanine-DL-glutamate epimerase-like enolase superfamily enzyme|nr:enolase C-terminal domain-like protein [Acidobacteriaceae bacterium]
MMVSRVPISKVQIAECSIPLPRALRLGSVEIRTRDYVVLRIETLDGVFGEAIGYPRGTPLFEVLSNMGWRILGEDSQMRRQVMSRLENSNIPARAALTRGLSLIDIALWDIASKRAAQPLFRFLGGLRTAAEATVVAGYYMDQRSIPEVVDEVALLRDAGSKRIKIMLRGDDPAFDRRYASAVNETLPGCIAADAHWSWTTITEARRICRFLDTFGFNFLEDPFSAADLRFTRELRDSLITPIAAGEDVFGPGVVADLLTGIDILRVDATTVGGVTGAIEAINLAAAAGRTVLPHVFAPLHVHFACAFPNVEGVEWIPEQSGADPINRLLRDVPALKEGKMCPSEEPGAGISVDWAAIEAITRRHAVIAADGR